jgi:hypothetical protein
VLSSILTVKYKIKAELSTLKETREKDRKYNSDPSPYLPRRTFYYLFFILYSSMCSGSHDPEFLAKLGSAHEHMSGRIDSYVNAWNRGDMDAVMDTFVEEELDYTDYGRPTPFLALLKLRYTIRRRRHI